MSTEREVRSLSKALAAVEVSIIGDPEVNRHVRIKIQYKGQVGNITLSRSPSDINVQRQRERQIRHELARIGVGAPREFNWRKI
jgi:hypothetical protein